MQTSNCPDPNGYFADSRECDKYTECKDGVAESKTCPEGLFFNDAVSEYPRYRCAYPPEVDCGTRAKSRKIFKKLTVFFNAVEVSWFTLLLKLLPKL